jgi:tRNA (cytidine/uridine-2'-O-)-methyltransferase
MRLALYQPDIPQNTGTILRMAACLGIPVDVVEPAGFDISSRALKRAGLDYYKSADIIRHASFAAFKCGLDERSARLILLTTQSQTPYHEIMFQPSDVLMVGRESAGVPEEIHAAAHLRVRIPIREDMRSLNVAVALAMVLGEGLRQTGGFSRFT